MIREIIVIYWLQQRHPVSSFYKKIVKFMGAILNELNELLNVIEFWNVD